MKKYISPLFLIIGFSIGMLLVYITAPPQKVIIVYPNPDNYKKFQYKDKAKNCFHVVQNKMPCPKDQKKIFKPPFQQ
jgi:hypothetical protein